MFDFHFLLLGYPMIHMVEMEIFSLIVSHFISVDMLNERIFLVPANFLNLAIPYT